MIKKLIAASFIPLAFVSALAHGQTLSTEKSVLLEAPKPLGDVRLLSREPEPETFVPVAKRKETDLQIQPIKWRGFSFQPQINSTQIIDTNILAANRDEEADTITVLNPSLVVDKKFGRHQANMVLEAQGKKYWSNTDNDALDARATVSGTLEARHSVSIPFELQYTSGHETRRQNFSQNISKEPIGFSSYGGAIGISYAPNRLNLSGTVRHGSIAFDNGETDNNIQIIREDDDRKSTNIELSAGYQLGDYHTPFLSFTLGSIDYAKNIFDGTGFNGASKDSDDQSIVAGWRFKYKGILYSYVGVGITERDYDDATLSDIETTKVVANLNWNVTKKSTFSLGLLRSISDNNDTAQGSVLSEARVSYDQEVLHNVFFNTFLEYANIDVESSTREDDVYRAGFGGRYDLNERFSVNAGYEYENRESTIANLEYDRHQFMVRLSTKF